MREELELSAKALRSVRARLERVGAVVSREVVLDGEGRHRHSSELRRWDQMDIRRGDGGLGSLLVTAVQAAVVAPEPEARAWFSWPAPPELVDQLVAEGRLARPDDGWLAAP